MIWIFVSALAGTWIGGQIRSGQTGVPVNPLICEFEANGRRYRNFPSVTRFYPAVLFAALAKPRWLWAMLGGVFLGWFVDERYEKALLARLFSAMGE